MSYSCKECDESFGSLRSLHAHIKKHGMYVGDYYIKNIGKKDKLTQELIPFKKYDQYIATDFLNVANMRKWCQTAPRKEAKEYVINKFKHRILNKGLAGSPPCTYLQTAGMPDIDVCKDIFGSYNEACKQFGLSPMLSKPLPTQFHKNYEDTVILVDTREQNPLKFKNNKMLKLDVGDYAVKGENFDYTLVDRKSYQDFCSTVTQGYNRFIKEIERCKSLDSFLFVVVETPFDKMEEQNKTNYKKFKLDYVFHRMREIQAKYSDCCQFVFSGSRKYSIELIPKILVLGKKLWEVDLQYFWNKHIIKNGLGNRKTETKKRIQRYKPVNAGKRGVFR